MRIIKYFTIAFALLFSSLNISMAQTTNSSEADLLTKQLQTESYSAQQLRTAAAPQVIKGKDENGDFEMTITQTNLRSKKGAANITTVVFKQNGKSESHSIADAGETVLKIESGKVLKSAAKGRPARLAKCIASFVKGGGAGSCATCFNSIKGCSGSTWYGYIFCVGGKLASNTCKPCVSSASSLIKCLKNAW
ncbi:MAG: hypothetical protein HW421_118 [Ignavibacteria bacterium]|nr:hypothetical protein [Ignavibacteria bacterium]